MLKQTAFVLAALLCCTWLNAQSWHWAKKALVSDNVETLPSRTIIDSRGNTVSLSLRVGRTIVAKHDANGNLLWKQDLFLIGSSVGSQPSLCVDSMDNIYLTTIGISRVNNTVVNAPGPFTFMKLNSSGRYLWSKSIDFPATSIRPKIVFSKDRIFLSLSIGPFGTALTKQPSSIT